MSVVTGLDAIRAAAKKQAAGGGKSRKDTFLKLEDGDAKKIWFLQELDDGSPNYDPERGLGSLVVEYRDPDNFRKRIVDTSDSEGRCWPAEQGWKPRTSLYINVYVEDEGKVKILNQGFGSKTIVDWLVEYAGDAGSITNVPFKIRRTGSGQYDTSYTLTPAGVPGDPKDVSAEDIIDINDVLQHVPYADQEEFFRGDEEKTEESESAW